MPLYTILYAVALYRLFIPCLCQPLYAQLSILLNVSGGYFMLSYAASSLCEECFALYFMQLYANVLVWYIFSIIYSSWFLRKKKACVNNHKIPGGVLTGPGHDRQPPEREAPSDFRESLGFSGSPAVVAGFS